MHPDAAIEARGRKGARRGRTEGGGRGDGGRIRRRKTIRRHDVLELKLKLLTGQDIMFIFFSSSVWPPTFPNVPILGLCPQTPRFGMFLLEFNVASNIPERSDLQCKPQERGNNLPARSESDMGATSSRGDSPAHARPKPSCGLGAVGSSRRGRVGRTGPRATLYQHSRTPRSVGGHTARPYARSSPVGPVSSRTGSGPA